VAPLRIALAGGAFVAAVLALGSARAGPAVTSVSVQALDFRYKLSRTQVPVGRVRFVVVNRGSAVHDFKIAGRATRLLARGDRQTLTVRFRKAGRYAFRCTIRGHAAIGMKGIIVVGRPKAAPPAPTPPPPPVSTGSVRLTEIGQFDRPVHVAAPPGDSGRIAVVEQAGRVRMVVDGSLGAKPFLDVTDRVKIESETGLLSIAFAPDYESSGRFYVYYNTRRGNGDAELWEYRRSARNPDFADPESGRLLLRVVKPWENHNAGMLQFGPDGYLYLAIGDGDSGVLNKPGAFAQALDSLLGSIIRIDPSRDDPYSIPPDNPFVETEGALPEIWAYGLRNPWRFWIDPPTGDLYIGDPGFGGPEEIDYVAGGSAGGVNFGWPCFQGSQPFDTTATCPGAVGPVTEYVLAPTDCAVIGGVVARDARLSLLDGRYLYGDFCGGWIRSFRIEDGKAADDEPLGVTIPELTSFGADGAGRVYVSSAAGGVYRLDPAQE
jgi:glucose/arabinose dehydrogenase